MSDILDEVLNDAKDEKKLLLFRQFLPKILGLTVIIAIIISLYNWQQYRNSIHNQIYGDMFLGIVNGEYQNPKIREEILEKLLNQSANHQKELTKLQIITDKIAQKDITNAMNNLESLAAEKGTNNLTASYARILWLNLLLDQDKITDVNHAKARDYFQYFNNEKQEFFATNKLQQALFYQKNSQYDLAKEYALKVLSLEKSNAIIKDQAKAVIATIEREVK